MPDGDAETAHTRTAVGLGMAHRAEVAPGAGPSGHAGAAIGLRVGGFVPFTTTDYPGALAAVVFCQGCPWRCAYCHNPHLIPGHGPDHIGQDARVESRDTGFARDVAPEFGQILDWLRTRRGLLDAVVFSGGEPTAQAALVDAIAAVRELGFAIGLHTGGAYPRRLARTLPLVDWVGFDVKAPLDGYASVTGMAQSGAAAAASLDLVLRAGIAYEVRTTVHPALTPPGALLRIAVELAAHGVARWVLQPFRATGCADAALVATAQGHSAPSHELLTQLREYVASVQSRF